MRVSPMTVFKTCHKRSNEHKFCCSFFFLSCLQTTNCFATKTHIWTWTWAHINLKKGCINKRRSVHINISAIVHQTNWIECVTITCWVYAILLCFRFLFIISYDCSWRAFCPIIIGIGSAIYIYIYIYIHACIWTYSNVIGYLRSCIIDACKHAKFVRDQRNNHTCEECRYIYFYDVNK